MALKRKIILSLFFSPVFFLFSFELNGFKWDALPSSTKFRYAEDFYRLYYIPQKPENQDLNRNIFWLRWAVAAPFAPPIFALKPPKNERAYEKYKKLMRMHFHFLITKNILFLAARFDKHRPVFYNLPYKEDILKSLDIAEYLYQEGEKEWQKVLAYYRELRRVRVRTEINFLEDALYKISTKEVDYSRVIQRKLKKLARTKEYFSE